MLPRRRGSFTAALLAMSLAIPMAGSLWATQPAEAAPGDPLDAQVVSVGVNGAPYSVTGAPVTIAADHVLTVDVVMKNTGTWRWGGQRPAGEHTVSLMTRNPDFNTTFGTFLIAASGEASTGESLTYHTGLRAPSAPGNYTMTWQLADWGPNDMPYGGTGYRDAPFFGETVTIHVTVTSPATPPTVPAVPSDVVSASDFVYQGSFALPPVPGAAYDDNKYYTESGIALRTVGGEKRLLALTGTYDQALYEVAIPPLGEIKGADTSGVPTAVLRNNFGGLPVTANMSNGTIWYDQDSNLFYWENHGSGATNPVLRAADLSSGTLNQVQQWTGPATIGGVTASVYYGGVTGIPAGFATQYTGGRTLAFGFGGTYGPALAAASAPAAGGQLDFLPIMSSNSTNRTVRDGNFFSATQYDPQPADPWTGQWTVNSNSRVGVFVDLPDKKGYVSFAQLPTGRVSYDGNDGDSQNTWYVYDYATLGAAATGATANLAPTPSSYANFTMPGDGTRSGEVITGAAFDPSTRLLYVYVRNSISMAREPIVDVYRVRETSGTGVTGVPTAMTAGTALTLTATLPAGTGQRIAWSLSPADAGTTGATVAGSRLTATAAGTATVRTSVINGTTGAVDYTQDFPVTVRPASAGAKQITRFTVSGVDGVIDEVAHTVTVTLPSAANMNGLKPDITFTGASVTPASGVSENFAGDWRSSAILRYTVTAEDGTIQMYRVVVGTADARIYTSLNGPYTATGQNTAAPGASATMTFQAINYGLLPADDLALVLTTPAGVTPADLTVSYSGVASTYDPATGWWRIPHENAATIQNGYLVGGGARLNITFTVPATAKTGDHFIFTGQLVNVNGQPVLPGDVSYMSPGKADYLVVQPAMSWPLPRIDTANWAPGAVNHSYDLVLMTYGTAALTDVVAVHRVPDGFSLVSATANVGTYDAATGEWTIASFTPTGNVNDNPRLTMVVTPTAGPPPTPVALSLQVPRVYGTAPDPALGTTVYVGLSDVPALRLTAVADVDKANPGDTVVHTLTLGTNTPAGVYGAKVTVTLPAHVSLVSAVSPGGGSFDQATGTWTAAPLGSGVTSTLTLTYKVDASAPDKADVTTAAIAAAIPTLGFNSPASALVTTTVTAPSTIAPVTIAVVPDATNIHTVVLTWTTPNDPANSTGTGQPAAYDVRYSENPITAANFDAATKADMTIAPQHAGDTERLFVNALATGKTYYFAEKTLGTTGEVSAMSNVVSATTTAPSGADSVTVASKYELQEAINSAPPQGRVITVANGSYEQVNTIIIQDHNNITIQGATSDPADTVFYGHGMNGDVIHNVYVNNSSYVTIRNLTLKDSYTHGIQIANGSQYFHADNLVVWDNGESAFKISAGEWGVRGTDQYSDYGVIENCHLGFTTAGARAMIEGVDGVAVKGWLLKNNLVENVRYAGPGMAYGLYFKGNSIDSDIVGNTVINSDIGISFGNGSSGYTYFRYGDTRFEKQGGLMANNLVKSTSKDTGIVLRGATGFKVYNNTVWNTDAYFYNSISIRVSDVTVPAGYPAPQPSQNGEIANNIFRFAIEPDYGTQVNQLSATIVKRNNLAGGQSVATGLDPALFVDAAGGDFHLAATATAAIGTGANLSSDLTTDLDGVARPATGVWDIGAYQFTGSAVRPQTLTFAATSVTKAVGDPPFTNALTQDGTGALTFTSSDESVATVAANGQVTIKGPGTTTITVSAAAVAGQWEAATASYSLRVDPDATAKRITGFAVNGVVGTINETTHQILVPMPAGTDLSALAPAITIEGASVSPASGVAQDFSVQPGSGAQWIYTVTAVDGSKQAYQVVVAIDDLRFVWDIRDSGGMSNYTSTVAPGATKVADFTLYNWGLRGGNHVVASVPLPAGIDPAGLKLTGPCAYDASTGLLDFGTIAPAAVSPASGLMPSGVRCTLEFTVPATAKTGDEYHFNARVVSVDGSPWTGAPGLPIGYVVIRPSEAWLNPGFTGDGYQTAVGNVGWYYINLDPGGTGTMTDVRVTHHIPAGLTLVSATPDVGTYDPVTGIWSIDTLAGTDHAILSVLVDVAGPAGVIPLSAEVTQINGSVLPSPITFSQNMVVHPALDVSLTATADHTTAAPGATVTHTITLTSGSDYLDYAYVYVTLPDNATMMSSDAHGGMFDSFAGSTSVWQWVTPNGVGAGQATLTVTYAISGAAPDGSAITTSAEFIGASPGCTHGIPHPPSASVTTTVAKVAQPQTLTFADATVTKTYGDPAFRNALTQTGTGAVTYLSWNTAAATVDSTGLVTITGAGTARITAMAAAVPGQWFETSASFLLTVEAADLSGAVVEAAGAPYTGLAQTPAVTVRLGGVTLVSGTDYTVAYSDNTNAGAATVTVTGRGNYAGTAVGHFTIAPRVVTFAIDPIPDQTATGSALTPPVVVRDGATPVPTGSYTVSYSGNTDPGTATVAVTGTGNYAGSTGTTTFTITTAVQPAQPQTLTFAQSTVAKVVGDAPFTNALTHVGTGALSFTTTDPGVATVDSAGRVTITGPGLASITVVAAAVPGEWLTASASYTLTVTAPLRSITLAAVTVAGPVTATGAALTPAVTVSLGGVTLVEGTDYTLAYSNNTAPGTGVVTVTGIGGYTGTVTGYFTILAPAATLSLSRASWAAPAGASTTDVTVTTNQATWSATSDQAWLAAKVQGSVLTLTAGANPLLVARTATVTVTAGSATATVAVTQAAGTVAVGAASWVLDTAGGKTTISVSSSAGWVVSGLPAWLTAAATSGTAGAPLNLTAAAYTGGAWDIRTATLTISLAGTDPSNPVRTQVEVRQHNWPGGDKVILHDGVLVTTVRPGWKVDGVASGFAPGETVHGWMHSWPLDLGTAVANANGVVAFTWVIPADTPAGAHRLEMIGASRTVDVSFTALLMEPPIEVPSGGTAAPPAGWLASLLLTGAGLALLGMGWRARPRRS